MFRKPHLPINALKLKIPLFRSNYAANQLVRKDTLGKNKARLVADIIGPPSNNRSKPIFGRCGYSPSTPPRNRGQQC